MNRNVWYLTSINTAIFSAEYNDAITDANAVAATVEGDEDEI